MATPRIKSAAILIGYNREGKCVYSEFLELSDYYDQENMWDKESSIRRLKLQRLKGYLFDSKGSLDQEFENEFDVVTGKSISRYARFADGTVHNEPAE